MNISKQTDRPAFAALRSLRSAAGAALVAVAATACTVDTGTSAVIEPALPAPALSTLSVRWTIDGFVDPNICLQSQSAGFELTVFDAASRQVGVWQVACTFFAINVTLDPGNYTASAVLLDGAGFPRTTSVFIDPFTLFGNDTLDIPVDFPADSFL